MGKSARWILAVTVGLLASIGVGASAAHYLQEPYNPGFLDFPTVVALHVVLGGVYLALAPFQFVRRIRSRHLDYHRWAGRMLVSVGVVVGLSALFMGLVIPKGGWPERVVIGLFGSLFLFALVEGFLNVRAGRVALHREWMIRAFAVGLAIATARLIFFPALLITMADPTEKRFGTLLVVSLAVAFVLHAAVAELWIRSTRNRAHGSRTPRMARARDAKASPSTTSGSSTSTTRMATAGRSSRSAPATSEKGYMTMPEKGTSGGAKTFDVVVTRVLDAPVEEVWKAWKDPAYVMRWWGPTGFTSPSAEMDFRMGGSSLVCMRAPAEYGGQDMYNTWTYTRIEPDERIEFVSNFAAEDGTHLDPATMGMPPGVPHDVPHVVTLEAAGEDRTEVTVTEHGYTTEQARNLSRAGMEQCLDKMAATFAE